MEMSLANLGASVMKGEQRPYTNEEINTVREDNRGQVDYEFNLDSYLLS